MTWLPRSTVRVLRAQSERVNVLIAALAMEREAHTLTRAQLAKSERMAKDLDERLTAARALINHYEDELRDRARSAWRWTLSPERNPNADS